MDPSREPGPEYAETEEEGRLDSHDLQPARLFHRRQQRGEGLKSMILILICVTDCSIKEVQ